MANLTNKNFSFLDFPIISYMIFQNISWSHAIIFTHSTSKGKITTAC